MKKLIVVLVVFISGISFLYAQDNVSTITGNITEVKHPTALLKSDDGNLYKLFLGPYWYCKNNGYNLLLEQALVKGVIKNGNIYPYEITQSGSTIKLKNENGVALWGGKGRGRNCPYNKAGNNNKQNNGPGYGRGPGNNPNCPYNRND